MSKAPSHIESPSLYINVTSTSSATSLGSKAGRVILQNAGSNIALVTTGGSSDTIAYPAVGTVVNGTFLLPNAIITVSKEYGDLYVIAICDTGKTTTITAQFVEGD